ncbi:transcriptional regulator, AsnC family [Pasteurella testudinis DSM 23072]|uniref:Transcriptional regulator, AsnC family n=1 Tax=Pasteurella testudinis DSM 23072 TaxID=1122938 RepID=A0A1W1V6U2_9PAST|nr:Lrp/AsnC family transcriptional regulator [Pasteurella testudinis]SMB89062.1 transcriptional regulator, AsnC family [Pasteurella testudinis DSM 23072]SUB50212.1 leucine-responsive transcriptional regulator [Pasteurella testudinis]
MDSIDKKILAVLQENGRISLTELADMVNISLSPCQRRVRAMEQAGVIDGYRARLNPNRVGLNFSAMVFVMLKEVSHEPAERFEQAIKDIPEIVQADRLFGETDYLLHITTRDLDSFQVLYDRRLVHLPNVQRMTSTLVMKKVIPPRGLPL